MSNIEPVDKVTAKDVLAAIFARHSGPEWVRFAEVANSTGVHARRRADAICMNIWPSGGYALHGFEIKVSRGDFIHEMKDITKAEVFAQFCDFWWLATPVGLVSPDEVPATWGLIELQKNGLRIKKHAPKREAPEEVTRGFMAAMLRKSRDMDDAYIQTQVEARVEAERESIRNKMALERQHTREKAEKNAQWIAHFEEALGIPFRSWIVGKPTNLAKRLEIAASLESGTLSHIRNMCERVVKQVDEIDLVSPSNAGTETAE